MSRSAAGRTGAAACVARRSCVYVCLALSCWPFAFRSGAALVYRRKPRACSVFQGGAGGGRTYDSWERRCVGVCAHVCVCVSVHHAHSQCTACGVLCVCTHVPACLSVVTVTVCMHRVRVSHCSRTGQLSCHSRDCCRGVRAAAGRWLSGWLALCVTHGGVV